MGLHNATVLPQFIVALLLVTSTVTWKREVPSLRAFRKRLGRWLKSVFSIRRPCRSHALAARGARSWLDC